MNAIQQLLTDHIDIWTDADITKKSGRGRSSGNAAGVYGIRKLRELILELAVHGKLLQQEYEWRNLKLSDLGFWAIGSGFPTTEQGSQNEEILFVKVSDMNLADNEKYIVAANNTITKETAKRLRINVHSAGTVIFPKIGGAIATNKRRILTRDTAIDNNCLGLTPKSGVSTDWLYLFLSSIDLSKYQVGTSVPALAQGVLQEIHVMLPVEEEQHRIVAKVDELMALCDQLETRHNNATEAHEKVVRHLLGTLTQSQSAEDFSANWQRIAAHFDTLFTTEASIDALKQTLLQLAVMGKLVLQDPKDEPASAVLEKISEEKAQLVKEGKIKNQKIPSKISDNEKPFKLPIGMEWARLQSLVFLLGDGLHGTPSYTPGTNYYFVNGNNLTNGKIEIKPDTKTVSYEEMVKHKKNMSSNTVLVSINGTIGNVAFYNGEEIILGKSACYFNLSNHVSKHFIKILVESPYFMSYALHSATGSTINNLSLRAMNDFPVPFATLAYQHRIVAKLNELMALCDQLKSRITQTNQLQQKLADVVVEQAVA